ncbi:MAG: MotB family protein [Rhizobiaceae bacterium]
MLDGEEKQEIIIIKRGSGDGDGHHGGAWKIAFADFMTAMMALFLVLWLVNAANEETKKSVASYFNPVKLVDRNRSVKGLLDPKTGSGEDDNKQNGSSDKSNESGSGAKVEGGFGDSELFQDPSRVLNEIANGIHTDLASSGSSREEITPQGDEDDAFADPFAPQVVKVELDQDHGTTQPVIIDKEDKATKKPPVPAKEEEKERPSEKDNAKHETPPEKESQKEVLEKPSGSTDAKDLETTKRGDDGEKAKLAAAISDEINERLSKVLGNTEKLTENLSVRLTDDGVLISITDRLGFSMFQVGSAVPKGHLVLAMKEISDVLSEKQGGVRIYGHTDGRPYASRGYDNWNLSTARAHSARFMLGRGGLPAPRISQIAGFADRKLIDPASPESAVNRRIEILLEVR